MDPEIKLGNDDAYPVATATAIDDATTTSYVGPRLAYVPFVLSELNSDQLRTLQDQGFPIGLAKQIGHSCYRFPRRYWVLDNSGSMRTSDVSG
jgi:hypothetical protein